MVKWTENWNYKIFEIESWPRGRYESFGIPAALKKKITRNLGGFEDYLFVKPTYVFRSLTPLILSCTTFMLHAWFLLLY
jgi:hypothetical protein